MYLNRKHGQKLATFSLQKRLVMREKAWLSPKVNKLCLPVSLFKTRNKSYVFMHSHIKPKKQPAPQGTNFNILQMTRINI